MVLKGFVYTNTAYFYAFLPCIWHHFALHLAPFHLAFSTKTHAILHQNAVYFAPKRTTFCCK